MKLTCDKTELQDACSIAARAAASKSTISALEGLKLTVENSALKITGYDMKKAIYITISCDADENTEIVLNAKLFCEMLRRMPEGRLTLIADENKSVTVKCGRSEYNISGSVSDEYPELPEIDTVNTISLPQNILKNMISKTIFAIADNDSRPVYTGTLFEIEEETLTLVSVDGYRLAKRTEKIEGQKINPCSFIIPGYSLSDIEKICTEEEGKNVSISIGTKHISFEFDSTVVITRRLEGDFLNYKKAIPVSFKYKIEANRNDVISIVDRVSLLISDKIQNPIRMSFLDGKIYCYSITPIGKAEDTCLCEGNGDNMEIGFNDRYLMDAFKAASTEKIKICFSTPSSPCIIVGADESEAFTYMVLPVRLRAGD